MRADRGLRGSLGIFKLVLIVLLISALLLYPVLFWAMRDNIISGAGDFVIFFTGAKILRAGMGARLYDYDTQMTFQNQVSHVGSLRAGPLLFNHLPFELLLFLPLAYMPFSAAYFTWLAINVGLLIATLRLMAPFSDRHYKVLSGLLLFGFFPVFITLVQGQDSILSAFLLTATLVSLKHQRDGLAGLLLSLGLFKPQLVLPLAGVLLFQRRWVAVLGFLIGGAWLLAISLGMVGWHGAAQFVTLLGAMNRQHYSIDPAAMPNVRGFFETLLAGHAAPLASLFVWVVSLALFLWLLERWRGPYRTDAPLFSLQWAFSLVVTVLTSYHLLLHDLTVLAAPAILILNYLFTGSVRAPVMRAVFFGFLLMLCSPLLYTRLLGAHRLAWFFWILLGLAGALAFEISARRLTVEPV